MEFGLSEFSPTQNRGSETSRLIEGEPHSSMKLCVVVPMYFEYENGNVFRLIDSFTKQSTPPEQYEIIFLVNNTPEAAEERSTGYLDNQRTLAIDKYLNEDGALPEGLNDYRKNVLEKARKKGVVLHMIDRSTKGVERNIGKIRDIGLEEAIRRFQTNGQGLEGLVAQLDADTVVESHYVDKILKHFSDPEVESLFIHLDYFTPEGTEDLFRTSFHHQYRTAFDQWFNTLQNSKVKVGGPQTIARVRAYQRVGGIVHQEMAEDFRLAESLSTQTEYKFAPDTRVYTSDRAREEGYDAKKRLEIMTGEDRFRFNGDMKNVRPRVLFFKRELQAVVKTRPGTFASEEQMKAYFDKYQIPFDYSKFKKMVLDQSLKTIEGQERPLDVKLATYIDDYIESCDVQIRVKSNQFVDEAIELLKTLLSPDETARLDQLVRQNAIRSSFRLGQSRMAITEAIELVFEKGFVSIEDFIKTPKTREFIERNPWLIDKLNSMNILYPSSTKAIEEMKKEFPEWLESFENSRLRRDTVLLHALTIYLRDARNEPSKYPTTLSFLKNMAYAF